MQSKTRVAVALVVLLVGAGCGQSKDEKAMADVCAARDDISKQVDGLKGLTVTTATTNKVTDGLQAIRNNLSKIADATGDLSDEHRKAVQAANEEFAAAVRETLRSVPTTLSVADASSQIGAAFTDLESSYQDTFRQLDCS